jgi:diketogulonate reductase-like aldo/keto reductase
LARLDPALRDDRGFERLKREGKIRYHAERRPRRRGRPGALQPQPPRPEWDLLPWWRERGVAVIAYTPLGRGSMLRHQTLAEIARRGRATPAQIGLAWLPWQDGTIVIPKAVCPEHVRENRGALDIARTEDDLEALDRTFPPLKDMGALGIL